MRLFLRRKLDNSATDQAAIYLSIAVHIFLNCCIYFLIFDCNYILRYTALIEKFQAMQPPPSPSDIPIQLIKDALINVRQHEAFLRILLVSS